MTSSPDSLVLPRPFAGHCPARNPIAAPTEAAFTSTFGALLPPANFLTTDNGRVAYYSLPPTISGSNTPTPDRVLFLHGVQTPALGMLPLAGNLHASFPSSHFVLVDIYGHGLSDTPFVPHTPELFHSLIDTLLNHLGWPSAHLVGFSFGGATTIGYVASRPSRVQSFALVAPAGLYRSSQFNAELLRGDDEAAAHNYVLELLEGGQLVVPADWKQRVAAGEVVAEALRNWQMRKHPGHAASVVAIFRDGGAMDKHAEFAKAAKTGIPSIVVLGELDDICTERDLNDLGFSNVAVVPQAGHGVVREKMPEVAALIEAFWNQKTPQQAQ
ncbi:hypothetical protein LTR36_011013 [Oleoguttula mirabilis]|uniref:AB hydrolase-1 domain-containing protein n=1 Tax=Oleoguttula mirabilis TaxID=1507867 RepID=A0AAV9J401_9PEZI|nr:hypothetical protein LTR36_011013 [Oleoguttula mirabilis]